MPVDQMKPALKIKEICFMKTKPGKGFPGFSLTGNKFSQTA